MPKSMTGFGRGKYSKDNKDVTVEIKTVNHRYCDLSIKMPRIMSCLEDKIRDVINKNISRGKVDVFVSYSDFSDRSKKVAIDENLAHEYLNAAAYLRDKLQLKDDISVSYITQFPDVFSVEKYELDEGETWELISIALNDALQSITRMRSIEGEGLKTDLIEKTKMCNGIIKDIEERSGLVVLEYKGKLENRIKELLDKQTIDEGRIEMEVAIFADRASIDEEITRLTSHFSQFIETLNNDGEPIGRKLDFIVQEMNREINTIGSKSNDLLINKNVVEMKSIFEKLREQVQNIE